MSHKEAINAISNQLENIAMAFERSSNNGLLIMSENYRPIISNVVIRLAAASRHCGLRGHHLHNPRRHTLLNILFEYDNIRIIYGDVYLLSAEQYNNKRAVNLAALYASNFGKYRIINIANKAGTSS